MDKQNAFFKKHAELWKLIKFIAAGFISTVIELVVYYILQATIFAPLNFTPVKFWIFEYSGAGYMWAFFISTSVGYAIAFVLNRKITFKADANPSLSAALYMIMVILTICATTWMGAELMDLFIAHGRRELGEAIAKPITAIAATLWTYPINRFVIHRRKKSV